MTAKSTTKKIVRNAFENKYTAPVAKTIAVPVLVVGYVPMYMWATRKSVNP